MFKNLINKIVNFAKRKPSLFIVIVIVAVFLLLAVTYETLHLTSTPQFCSTCHKDAHSGPGGEYYTWEKNIHEAVNVGCIDCHGRPGFFGYMRAKIGGLYDVYAEIVLSPEEKKEILTKGATDVKYASELVPSEWCAYCHTDEVNKETRDNSIMSFFGFHMRDMDKIKNPEFRQKYGLPDLYTEKVVNGVDPNHAKHVKELGLSCVSCHLGVAHGGEFINKTKMETCFACHDVERPKKEGQTMPENEDCASCHSQVVDIQKGEFLQDKGIETTEWYMPSLTGECSSCHVDAFTAPTAQTCIDCHDESYGEIMTSTIADFNERKNALTPVWINLYKQVNSMTDEQRAIFKDFNYFMGIINNDGSKGNHNTDLMSSVFDKADELAKQLQESMQK